MAQLPSELDRRLNASSLSRDWALTRLRQIMIDPAVIVAVIMKQQS